MNLGLAPLGHLTFRAVIAMFVILVLPADGCPGVLEVHVGEEGEAGPGGGCSAPGFEGSQEILRRWSGDGVSSGKYSVVLSLNPF